MEAPVLGLGAPSGFRLTIFLAVTSLRPSGLRSLLEGLNTRGIEGGRNIGEAEEVKLPLGVSVPAPVSGSNFKGLADDVPRVLPSLLLVRKIFGIEGARNMEEPVSVSLPPPSE